jgi:purine-binding chemotaxis protein CheW
MSISGITETTQHLTFNLDEEVFAVDITKVREVLEYTAVTKVPKTPEFMKGVINLRGHVVPVVDLRLKFGMQEAEKTVNTCIIIVEVTVDKDTAVLGALADSVQEVHDFEHDQIEPPPKIGTRLNTDFIKGMGKQDDRFIMILDIDKVFSSEGSAIVQDAGSYSYGDIPKESVPNSAKTHSEIEDKPEEKSAAIPCIEKNDIPSELTPKLGFVKQYLENDECKVTFRLSREVANYSQNITLVGDFNDWNTTAAPMTQLEDGSFQITLILGPAMLYKFRYLVDGHRWENDSYADNYIANDYGWHDSAVIVWKEKSC